MKKILAAVILFLASFMATPVASQAETCFPGTSLCQGGVLDHYSPDSGYDPAIIVFCKYQHAFTDHQPDIDWSKAKYIAEGKSSSTPCGDDTDVIYIRSGEELWCKFPAKYGNPSYWSKSFDATGPHKINDLWDKNCTLRKD